MSNSMLEQAIIDAQSLREAALKNAESAIVEKYADEVRSALNSILEQDEEIDPLAPEGLGLDMEEETADIDTTALEGVPMAHIEGDNPDEVVVDLRDILAAVEDDDPSAEDAIDATRDHSDVANNIGVSLDSEAPANRDDEIELDPAELVNMFKEILVVDVPQIQLDRTEEKLNHDQIEQDEASRRSLDTKKETIYTDGMDSDDIEEYVATMAKNESLKKENHSLTMVLREVKKKLQELNLQNARLFYANRVLTDHSLNEQQKTKIVDMVRGASSVEESRTIFETLQKTLASNRTTAGPKSLSEAVSRSSSVILSSRRSEERASNPSDPTYSRWAILAGTTDKN